MTPQEQMVDVIKSKYGLDSPKVLEVMLEVPRDKFVPKKHRSLAYDDRAIYIGHDQTMSQPYTVASMTHLLVSARVRGKDSFQDTSGWKVLEIGTGSGYQAAVLSKLFKEVYSIEIVPALAHRARKLLKRLKYPNIYVKTGSGVEGWPGKAPFDAVMVTAAIKKKIPEKLVEQLKVGGVIVAPIGPRWSQTMTRYTKLKSGKLKKEKFEKYVFVPFVESGE
jgi:protein-L-isoaspartate(D-aspartate) O-methyltransferase